MSRILMIVGSRREGNSIHLANNLKTIFDHNRISSDIIVPGNQKIYLCLVLLLKNTMIYHQISVIQKL